LAAVGVACLLLPPLLAAYAFSALREYGVRDRAYSYGVVLTDHVPGALQAYSVPCQYAEDLDYTWKAFPSTSRTLGETYDLSQCYETI
jgi:hypothetical protein